MRKMNRYIVLMAVVGLASGLLFAQEDSDTDAEDAVRVLRLLGGKGGGGPVVHNHNALPFEL